MTSRPNHRRLLKACSRSLARVRGCPRRVGAVVSTCMLGGTRRDGCSCGIPSDLADLPSESHRHERPPLTISPLRAQPLRVDLVGEINEISEIDESVITARSARSTRSVARTVSGHQWTSISGNHLCGRGPSVAITCAEGDHHWRARPALKLAYALSTPHSSLWGRWKR